MNPEETGGNNKKLIAAAVVLVVVVLIVVGVKAFSSKDKTEDSTSNPSTSQQTNEPQISDPGSSSASELSPYKDGTYSAVGTYESPGGQEAVKVTITLDSGIVTDSKVTSEKAGEPEAEEHQALFISGYKSQVTGKSIDSIKLSRVSGSSLTSTGFNNAISKIKDEAKN